MKKEINGKPENYYSQQAYIVLITKTSFAKLFIQHSNNRIMIRPEVQSPCY